MAGGVRLAVHAVPGARRNEIVGPHGDALKIKVAAPPEDGRANAELGAFLASVLGVAKGAVRVVSGASSRRKVVEILGVDAAAASAALRGR